MDQALLDEFLAECGMPGPFAVEVGLRGDPATRVHELRQPFLVIGRRAGSDLLLDHWQVSRRHAFLQLIEGRFYGVDLGSRTGTHGGDATERTGWLEPGRAIQVGPYFVRPALPPIGERDYPPLPNVTWTISGPSEDASFWSMNRGLALIGRSPACRVRLADVEVSRFHCALVLTTGGTWAVDLLSQRPMLLNGRAVRFGRVEPGDELQVGRHRLIPAYEPTPSWAGSFRPAPPGPDFPGPGAGGGPDPGSSDLLPALPPPALTPSVLAPGERWPRPPEVGLPPVVAADPALASLVEHFGAMQQQMFDQFHQTMMIMFEGFAALHRETSASIRQEFDEVRRLSREIEALREETGRIAEVATLSLQQPAFLSADRHLPPAASAGPVEASGAAPLPATRPDPRARVVPPPPDPNVDIHAKLFERLNHIQAERQSRWQKILGMMAARP